MKMKENCDKGKVAIFLMGCGGSGKTTFRSQNYSSFPVVDPDDFLFNPAKPSEGRELARAKAFAKMISLVDKGESFVRDTTGTNIGRMIQEVTLLREQGYFLILIFLDTPLQACLERNSSRERVVPEEVIKADFESAQIAFGELSLSFDVVRRVKK